MCKEGKRAQQQKDFTVKELKPMNSPKKSLSNEHQQVDPAKEIILKSIIAARRQGKKSSNKPIDYFCYLLLFTIILITLLTYPSNNRVDDVVTIHHVWYHGWITAVATGVGVIPFIFLSEPNKFWMGISNGKLYI